jgi:O-antigen/teichoic acid export membrane protein
MNFRIYVRQVAVLLFGNVAAQLINLASYPVLTRLYSPADFGGFALFLTVVGILGPVACARFDLPIQSSKEWQLPAVFRQALRMNIGVSLAAAVATGIYGLVTKNVAMDLAILVGFGVFLSGYTLAALALLVRLERFPLYSRSLLLRSLVTAAAQILLWLVLAQALGLILGFCAGLAAQAIVLRWGLRGISMRRSTSRQWRAVTARYRRQVLTDIPSTLLAGVVLNVLNVLILDLYSRDEVGYYALAFRVAVLPLTLISGPLSDVFYQKACASYRASGAFWNELRFNVGTSAMLSLAIFIPLGVLARPVFAIAFGSKWLPSAEILLLLLPMLITRFISATVQTAPLVIGQVRFLLFQHIGLVAVIVAVYAAGKLLQLDIRTYLLLTSCSTAVVYAAYLLSISALVWRNFRVGSAQSALRKR